MKTTTILLAGLAMASLAVAQAPQSKQHPGQGPKHGGMPMQMGQGMGMGHGMGMGMKMGMMPMMREMMAGQQKLEALAAKLNHSQGADRIDATTAVVNQMLANQKAMMKMCMNMMSMHGRMGPSTPPPPSGHMGHHGG